jgi:haloalkane dehalogenase
METIVRPMTWNDFLGAAQPRLETLRAPRTGETKVLDENFLVEVALRDTVLNGLSDEDVDMYRKPYPTRESRRPLLAWSRSFPMEVNQPMWSGESRCMASDLRRVTTFRNCF